MEAFAPQVIVDGVRVTPPGWMWVLGLALGGMQWEIEECEKPEFDLRGKIRDYNRKKQLHEVNAVITKIEKRLAELDWKRLSLESH